MGWAELLGAAFSSIQEPMSVVLGATGCREGWLQGELYRYFLRRPHRDPEFTVNEYNLGKGKKADLYGTRPTRMVAEIKLSGTRGYPLKNVHGCAGVAKFIPSREGERVAIGWCEIKALKPWPGSLLADALRLADEPDDIEKYLVLVIHKSQDGPPDKFGRATMAIKLPGEESTFDLRGALVRIWKLSTPPDEAGTKG